MLIHHSCSQPVYPSYPTLFRVALYSIRGFSLAASMLLQCKEGAAAKSACSGQNRRKNQGLRGPGTWPQWSGWGIASLASLIHCADHGGRLESSSGFAVNYFLDRLVPTIEFSTISPSGLSLTMWAAEPFDKRIRWDRNFLCLVSEMDNDRRLWEDMKDLIE